MIRDATGINYTTLYLSSNSIIPHSYLLGSACDKNALDVDKRTSAVSIQHCST